MAKLEPSSLEIARRPVMLKNAVYPNNPALDKYPAPTGITPWAKALVQWRLPPELRTPDAQKAWTDKLLNTLPGDPISFANALKPMGLTDRGAEGQQDWHTTRSKNQGFSLSNQDNADMLRETNRNTVNTLAHELRMRAGRWGNVADLATAGLIAGTGYGLYKGIPKLLALRKKKKPDEDEPLLNVPVEEKSAAHASPAALPWSSQADSEHSWNMNQTWKSTLGIDPWTIPAYGAALAIPAMLSSGGTERIIGATRDAILKRRKAKAIQEFQQVLTGDTATPKMAALVEGLNKAAEMPSTNTIVQTLAGLGITAAGASLLAGNAIGKKLAKSTDDGVRKMRAMEIALNRKRITDPVKLELVPATSGELPGQPQFSGGQLDTASTYRVPFYTPQEQDKRSREQQIHSDATDLTKLSCLVKQAIQTNGPQTSAASAVPKTQVSGTSAAPLARPSLKPAFAAGDKLHPIRDAITSMFPGGEAASNALAQQGGASGVTDQIQYYKSEADRAVKQLHDIQPTLQDFKSKWENAQPMLQDMQNRWRQFQPMMGWLGKLQGFGQGIGSFITGAKDWFTGGNGQQLAGMLSNGINQSSNWLHNRLAMPPSNVQ